MGTERFRRWLISISLVFALVLSIAFTLTPVRAAAVISYPGHPSQPQNIFDVLPGQTFTLRHRLAWDDPAYPGYYLIAIWWDYFADNAWHFTLDSAVAYFDNNGDNSPDPSVALIENTVSITDNGTRRAIVVSNAVGNDNEGFFNVDIVLRAAGPDGTPHDNTDNHPIYYIEVTSAETIPFFPVFPAPVTVRVLPWAGTAVFSLENMWAVRLEKNLDLYQGSKLVVKFYSYNDAFDNETVIETFSPPWHVEENEIVRHPENISIKKARLDLTTEDTENVISTIATFTVTRDVLYARIVDIYLEWPFADAERRNELNSEIVAIYLQWAFAPT